MRIGFVGAGAVAEHHLGVLGTLAGVEISAVCDLDELVREGDERPTMMTVAVHERWSGQAARASALRQFIEHAQSIDGVSFMRRCDIASWWLERHPLGR